MANYRISRGNDLSGRVQPGETVVLIDNLRASSTIVTALSLGVAEVLPVAHDEEAFRLKETGAVIAGESGATKLDGYDIGNSPSELIMLYKVAPFDRLALKTSNLTPLLMNFTRALICSSLNLAAMASYLKEQDALIIAVGGDKGYTEDLGVAFALCACMASVPFDMNLVSGFTKESCAARHLSAIGYGEDVEFIARVNRFCVIPWYDGTKIVAVQKKGKRHAGTPFGDEA